MVSCSLPKSGAAARLLGPSSCILAFTVLLLLSLHAPFVSAGGSSGTASQGSSLPEPDTAVLITANDSPFFLKGLSSASNSIIQKAASSGPDGGATGADLVNLISEALKSYYKLSSDLSLTPVPDSNGTVVAFEYNPLSFNLVILQDTDCSDISSHVNAMPMTSYVFNGVSQGSLYTAVASQLYKDVPAAAGATPSEADIVEFFQNLDDSGTAHLNPCSLYKDSFVFENSAGSSGASAFSVKKYTFGQKILCNPPNGTPAAPAATDPFTTESLTNEDFKKFVTENPTNNFISSMNLFYHLVHHGMSNQQLVGVLSWQSTLLASGVEPEIAKGANAASAGLIQKLIVELPALFKAQAHSSPAAVAGSNNSPVAVTLGTPLAESCVICLYKKPAAEASTPPATTTPTAPSNSGTVAPSSSANGASSGTTTTTTTTVNPNAGTVNPNAGTVNPNGGTVDPNGGASGAGDPNGGASGAGDPNGGASGAGDPNGGTGGAGDPNGGTGARSSGDGVIAPPVHK